MSIDLQEEQVEEKEATSEEESSPEQQEAEEEQPESDEPDKEAEQTELSLLEQLEADGGIRKRTDGKFEWVVDPDDPKSTRYVGESLTELLQNARKGFNDKDRYIAELKARNFGAEKPGRRVERQERDEEQTRDEDIESLVPNRDVIIDSLMKDRGLDPQMRRWSNTDWREYADEKGMRDFEVAQLQSKMERAITDGNAEYKDESVDFVDAKSLKEASSEIKEYLLDHQLDPDDFIDLYQQVVERSWIDQSFRKSNGLFNGSKLVRVMIAEVDKSRQPSSDTKKMQDKLNAAKKAAEEAKKNIKNVSSSAAKPKNKESAPKDIREAKQQLLKGMSQGRTYTQ